MNRTEPPARLDLAYYRERLADPDLADLAVPVEIAPGEYEAAVPCGSWRDAGQITVLDPELAQVAVQHLSGRDGFSEVRFGRAEPEHQAWPVEWGTNVPALPTCGHLACVVDHHYTAGNLYGYTMSAITSHVGRITLARYGRLPSPYG